MGALVTVMVSPKLADGCAVAKDAAAALVADGWTPPLLVEANALQPLEVGPMRKGITGGASGDGTRYNLPASKLREEPVLHMARGAGPDTHRWRTMARRMRAALGIPDE